MKCILVTLLLLGAEVAAADATSAIKGGIIALIVLIAVVSAGVAFLTCLLVAVLDDYRMDSRKDLIASVSTGCSQLDANNINNSPCGRQ